MVEVVRLGNIRGAIKVGVKKKDEATEEVIEEDATDQLDIADAVQAQDLFKAYSEVLAQKQRTSLASFFSDPLLEVHSDKIVFKVGSKLIADEINMEVKDNTNMENKVWNSILDLPDDILIKIYICIFLSLYYTEIHTHIRMKNLHHM